MIRAWTCKLKLRFQLLLQQVVEFTNSVIREMLKSGQFLKLAKNDWFDIAFEPLRYFLKEIKIWLNTDEIRKVALDTTLYLLHHRHIDRCPLLISLSVIYLSICQSVGEKRHQFTSLRRRRQETILILNHSKFFIFVFFYKCQSLSVPILDFGLWWRIWLQDDGSFFYGF